MAKKTKTKSRRAPSRRLRAPSIQTWPTDPMGNLPPVQQPAPPLPGAPLPTRIIDPARAPAPAVYQTGTAEFRYWTAADALRRCAAFWAAAGVKAWHRDVGASIPIRLDAGVDLNAYYARRGFPTEGVKQGLSFFHDTIREAPSRRRLTVFSGESPDIVAHELGHAVLDALKPALWGLASTEAAAFHESFGDMSAILTALQVPVVRQAVLEETSGNLRRNSSVSRVAEQLGFALRQRSPAAVDPDCLRNAANSFTYVDPLTLPASGPAAMLSRAPHNFSRVFTGAFLEALAGMIDRRAARPRDADVLQASIDMGRLLVRAIAAAPVRTTFFAAVAEQIVLADGALFKGRHAKALTTAFVRRGLISVRSLAAPGARGAVTPARAAAAAARFAAVSAGGVTAKGTTMRSAAKPIRLAIDGSLLGLPAATLFVEAPAVDDAPGVPVMPRATAAAREGAARYSAVQSFVEGLVSRGRVWVASRERAAATLPLPSPRATHYLERHNDALELRRITFECRG